MKRIAVVFILAILVPAVLLAVLAVRSLRDQELVVNSQRTLYHQSNCDALAADINLFMDDVRIFYGRLVDEFVSDRNGEAVSTFDTYLRESWSQAAVGAVVGADGNIVSPAENGNPQFSLFCTNHADFLENRRTEEVYWAPDVTYSQIQVVAEPEPAAPRSAASVGGEAPLSSALETEDAAAAEETPQKWKVTAWEDKVMDNRFVKPSQKLESAGAIAPPQPTSEEKALAELSESSRVQSRMMRNVAPMQQELAAVPGENDWMVPAAQQVSDSYSNLNVSALRLEELTEGQDEGAVGRIIDGELHLLLWKKPASRGEFTFWAELDLETIKSDISALFQDGHSSRGGGEVSLALLDSNGGLVSQTVAGFATDWSKPFVAAEVGQILPRWEVAAYLLDPNLLDRSARVARLSLWLITLVLLGTVTAGTILILRSVNYEMRLATQKTDFVSNVSHELKTPLTSIRMFSELLERAEAPDSVRTREYSGVISKEAARLTRLINRLLDFSRLDRGELKLNCTTLDLRELVRETVACYRAQMENGGLDVRMELPRETGAMVRGDSDALSQVLLNLFSNAEKYAAKGGEILVELSLPEEERATLAVRDRGPGIPRSIQRRIFDRFYRANDSITSGIEGSGIGLALCRQIVELHGGSIRYERRDGGGSSFLIDLPRVKEDENV